MASKAFNFNQGIFSGYFLFSLIIDLYFLISAVIVKNVNPIAELAILIDIPTKYK